MGDLVEFETEHPGTPDVRRETVRAGPNHRALPPSRPGEKPAESEARVIDSVAGPGVRKLQHESGYRLGCDKLSGEPTLLVHEDTQHFIEQIRGERPAFGRAEIEPAHPAEEILEQRRRHLHGPAHKPRDVGYVPPGGARRVVEHGQISHGLGDGAHMSNERTIPRRQSEGIGQLRRQGLTRGCGLRHPFGLVVGSPFGDQKRSQRTQHEIQ